MSATQMAALLYRLQQHDLELDRINAERQTVEHALQDNPRLRRLRSEYEAAQEQARAGLQAQKEAEWTLDDISHRLQTQEQRLYNSTTLGSKDLQALQQEVQRLRAQQSRQEEIVLEMIDTAEALQEQAQSKLQALREAEASWQQETAALRARLDQVEARKQECQEKRSQLLASIPPEVQTRYTAMRRSKQGRAVSKVEQNS
ncbi:MAG: hypothetical protein IMW89_18765, partial [Ktedonobacteraceae bacterium]|nr:hypothetical protein [Ktedonobacteraceae bacterium]